MFGVPTELASDEGVAREPVMESVPSDPVPVEPKPAVPVADVPDAPVDVDAEPDAEIPASGVADDVPLRAVEFAPGDVSVPAPEVPDDTPAPAELPVPLCAKATSGTALWISRGAALTQSAEAVNDPIVASKADKRVVFINYPGVI